MTGAQHTTQKKRWLACELTYISFVPIAPFKRSLLYCFSFKLFQCFTLEIAMESFWIIHLDGSLCIQEIVYLRTTWSRKVGKHHRYISGFFTRTSDEARTAVLISKYAKMLFLSAGLGHYPSSLHMHFYGKTGENFPPNVTVHNKHID